ncbi:MAG: HAD family hydrolase [Chloroflexi bacterium]|nr:HAD family hydrolase [Chloroflexota bacterium]
MTIKGVIFDLGSTLIEYRGEWRAVLKGQIGSVLDTLRASGLSLPAEFEPRYEALIDQFYTRGQQDWIEFTAEYTLQYALTECGALRADQPAEIIRGALAAGFAEGEKLWAPFADVYATLDTLKARSYKLGIVSNARDAANVERLIDQAQLRSWFNPIVISANAGVRKPHPRIFKIVLDAWQLPPDQVVMVGDMLGADILGAHNAGLRGIWATMQAERGANEAHQYTIEPDGVIKSLSELPGLLEGW